MGVCPSLLQSSLKERYDATKGATGKTYDDWSKQARLPLQFGIAMVDCDESRICDATVASAAARLQNSALNVRAVRGLKRAACAHGMDALQLHLALSTTVTLPQPTRRCVRRTTRPLPERAGERYV